MESEGQSSDPTHEKSPSDFCYSFRHEFNRNKIILYHVFLTTLFTLSVSHLVDHSVTYSVTSYLNLLSIICYISFILWLVSYCGLLLFRREPRPITKLIQKLKILLTPISKPLFFVLLVFALNVAFSNYTFFKAIIPYINPFYLDLDFYRIDKWLHFGYSPWEITHYLFPGELFSLCLNIMYNCWFFLMWGMLLYFILYRQDNLLRAQFLLTFLTSWLIIGNVLAVLFSSAGPAFLHHFDSQDLYEPLMQTLEVQNNLLVESGYIPLWALSTQDMLWSSYLEPSGGVGTGISAMPSMHVTIAVLLAIASYRLNRRLGYVAWIYAIFIQIGSVHLAWHYAIDGYLGALLVLTLWHMIGYLLRRFHPQINDD